MTHFLTFLLDLPPVFVCAGAFCLSALVGFGIAKILGGKKTLWILPLCLGVLSLFAVSLTRPALEEMALRATTVGALKTLPHVQVIFRLDPTMEAKADALMADPLQAYLDGRASRNDVDQSVLETLRWMEKDAFSRYAPRLSDDALYAYLTHLHDVGQTFRDKPEVCVAIVEKNKGLMEYPVVLENAGFFETEPTFKAALLESAVSNPVEKDILTEEKVAEIMEKAFRENQDKLESLPDFSLIQSPEDLCTRFSAIQDITLSLPKADAVDVFRFYLTVP